MFCGKCGKNVADDEYYCPYCGKQMPGNRFPTSATYDVTVGDCIKNFFKKGFTADGVANRKEFWTIFIYYIIQNIVLGFLGINYINTVLNIILFFPVMALTIRRYHDINKSGAWATLGGYAQIGYMFSFFFENKLTSNILLITAIIALVIQLFLLTKPTDPKSRWNPINGYM